MTRSLKNLKYIDYHKFLTYQITTLNNLKKNYDHML